jgi:hypothetical protein
MSDYTSRNCGNVEVSEQRREIRTHYCQDNSIPIGVPLRAVVCQSDGSGTGPRGYRVPALSIQKFKIRSEEIVRKPVDDQHM